MYDTIKMTALAAALGAMLGLAPLGFGQQAQGAEAHITIAGNAFGTTRAVSLSLNKSMILDLPVDAKEVIVGSPGIASAILRSKRRVILQGMGSGDTNIIFLDATGRQIVVLDVQVQAEESPVADALQATLKRILPNSNIKVETLSDKSIDGKTHYFLTGTVQTAQDKAVAESMAAQLSDEAAGGTAGGGQTSSLIQVVGPQQVMLKVTVAEVQRSIAKQLGVNLSGSFSVGAVSGNFTGGIDAVASGGGTVGIPFPNGSIDIELRALETRGAVKTLAEPVLTALSGQPADFLAGGELPYYTVDQDGNRMVTFKPYGVQLNFTPTINSDGTISLIVKSEVSEPGDEGSINTRRVSSTVQLGAGQTLSIGGLLSERSRQAIDKLPGLGDIPILGALFRSRDFTTDRTELVFLVTPYYARAKNEMPVLPTDKATLAGDAEAIFLGHIETVYGVGSDGMRGSYDGSVGFLLD
jgi:pilus assembly protein CpaC